MDDALPPSGPPATSEVDALLPRVYDELRGLAAAFHRREAAGHTLQPTAIVHEAYMRLARGETPPAGSRRQFFGIAARVIRQVLVDHARGRGAAKRGGDWQRISLDGPAVEGGEATLDVLELDEALDRLAGLNERQARVVELRFFAGMNDDEAGDVLGVSPRTVRGDWRVARAWLRRELGREDL